MAYRLDSVQVGAARKVQINGRSILTAIHKTAVAGPVPVLPLGLQGDEQADLSVHGGLEKAVYAYPSEHYAFWQQARREAGVAEIDDALSSGSMGENLTLSGLLEADVWVGDVLRFADCALRVVQPREPCFKFNVAMGFSTAVKAMALSGRCGFYLAVNEPGTVQAGERFTLEPGTRQMGIPELFKAKLFKHLR
ncbi:MOSC domain-containing protein [Rhodoferax sp. TS-BS-61-7]|uniref:MOSC domain-containing protein n=1 Tax=Rhodoferax sp. TS-BS-61-7 TaxID=2094194 RepID=UPI000CF5EC60|nr:MOSC domain-containing protein [Rhodoferax sp. TS-BS-61-7]PQA76054.1 MOSC domain-containing protein [Rhodoferax sp. TS-BS-61-7]